MAPFQVVFEPGEYKEVTGTEIRRIGWGNHRITGMLFPPKKIDVNCCVTWSIFSFPNPTLTFYGLSKLSLVSEVEGLPA
jgi:hypothetical protein